MPRFETKEEWISWIEKSGEFDVSSQPDKGVCWSGGIPIERKGELVSSNFIKKAEVFCKLNEGYTTLEQTPGGRILAAEKDNLNKQFGWKEAKEIFAAASKKYVQSLSGAVTCFVQGAREDSIFRQVELPTLLQNEKVTHINQIPREKLKTEYDLAQDKTAALKTIHADISYGIKEIGWEKPKEIKIKEIESRNPETREFEVTLPSGKEAHVTATGLEAKDNPKDLLAPEVIDELEKQKSGQTLKLNVTEVEQTLDQTREPQSQQGQSHSQTSQLANQQAQEQQRQNQEPSLGYHY